MSSPQYLALTVKLTLYGFVINRDAFRNSSHLVDVYELAQLLIYVTQTLIGDIFMVGLGGSPSLPSGH